MSSRWSVKHAIISGGSSGIGLAMAKALAADGSHITVLDLSAPEQIIEQIVAECKTDAQQVLAIEVNMTDATAVRAAVAQVLEQQGAPDFALNCAGIQFADNFEKIPDDAYDKVIMVNLIGSRNFAVAVLPTMQPGSQFALLASMGGLIANYAYSAYSASKFGVVGLAEVLRIEYAPVGIGISMICPPEVPTPMVEEESRHMHPVQRELKDSAGLVTTDELVPYALDKCVLKKQFRVIPGARARLMYMLSRYLPSGFFNWYVDGVVRKTFSSNPDAPRR